MAWESHEQNILENIARWVNPETTPEPDGSVCPAYHPGHGWQMFNSYRKLAYNDFKRVKEHYLEEMYNEARVRISNDFIIVDAPFGDVRGEEDDFMWRQVLINNIIVLISTRRRDDNWYDFCLTIFCNYDIPERPDIS